ncbi:ABC transporter permease [Bradyrhizobium manausense]|uniref:ABC transporter permease n=1 Tax=Bradyrhizobium manausense TaxID=989370 RepID=UPI001BA676A3|nr:ABC transporter permease [Bradyrhizobium manausense]MBR0725508.1 ABC transporter permease [Bradyrhizobium manausense]
MTQTSLPVRIAAACTYIFMFLPLMVIILFSFSDRSYFTFPPQGFSLKWYVQAWEGGQFFVPAIRSVALGTIATAIAAVLAIGGGLSIRRLKERPVARAIELTFLSPLIVPHLILGIALLHFFNPPGLIDTFTGLLLAHVVIVFPFMYRTVLVSIHDLNPQMEEASELLGASSVQTFRHVILPSLVPGLAAGGVLGFIVSFDQFTISMLITQREQITLPVAIYKYLYDVNDPVVAAVSSVLVAFGFALTLAVQGLRRANLPTA